MRPCLLALPVAAALAAPLCAADLRHFDDAALHAVQFVDANEGWTVGDEGVVWHTIDGGKNWERQPTASRASLRGVHFLTPYTGWIVGREEQPGDRGSVGVVLTTRDGGLKWQRLAANALPGLHRVHFFDDKNGLAVGDGSDQFPSGLFATADGGRTWKPVAGARCPGWLAADFKDLQTGALAGAWGRMAALRQGVLGTADVETLGGRCLHDLQLNGTGAMAVADGGVVLVSADSGGVRWGYANLGLSDEARACLDFHAVSFRGNHAWVAGRPGSVVLHSADRGRTWETCPTGQPLPLHALFFLNEQHGWAVGEFGVVLTTTDGGKTWARQREGGRRAAVLSVSARSSGVPFDTIALLGGEEGYLTAALRVCGADPSSAPASRATEPQRLGAAMRHAAGAAGETFWQFPVPLHLGRADKRAVLAAWDRLHGDQAADQFLRQLVLTLRIWQPDVVLTDDPKDESPFEQLVGEAIQEAFTRAADPNAFPEQIALGLKPWKASKLYARCTERTAAQVVYDLAEAKPRLQSTARDVAATSLGLVGEDTANAPTQAAYRLLASNLDGAANHRDLMTGISLGAGGTARRNLPPLPEAAPEVEKAVRLRRNLQMLAETPSGNLGEPERLLAQIGPVLASMPDEQGAPAALALADQFARAGQWTLAREAYLLMVDRYPAHPLSVDAYRWLIRYSSSSEARRRTEMGQFLAFGQLEPAHTIDSGSQSKGPKLEAKSSTQLTLLGDSLKEVRRWYEGSLEVEKRLIAFGPLHANDPTVQFPLQAARRNLGDFQSAQDWYTRFLVDHRDGPWHDAAAAELWLTNRNGPAPKPVALCRQAIARPVLDGSFDDACWQNFKPLKFRNAVGKSLKEKESGAVDESVPQEYATEAWFAYDQEFLYVALRCRHPAERYVPPVKARKRDADLRDFDRVSILLDLDRDYSTCFHFQVDQRGCLYDECWGDRNWNPKWFVAVRSDKMCWQIEAAIPMAELTGDPVTLGRAWACNVVRILPGRGVQAMSVPADVMPRPEGMGLLMFTQEAKTPASAQVGPPAGRPVPGSARHD